MPCSSCSCSFSPGNLKMLSFFLKICWIVCVQLDNTIFRTLQQWSPLWPKRRDVPSQHNLPPGTRWWTTMICGQCKDDFYGIYNMVVSIEKEFDYILKLLWCRIAEKSGRNLRRAILMVCGTLNSYYLMRYQCCVVTWMHNQYQLEACKVAQYPFSATQPIQELDWEVACLLSHWN